MYITRNIYEKYATFVDMPDREFFIASLEKAKEMFPKLVEVDADSIKANTPVCYMSDVRKRTPEEVIIDRKEMNTNRGRRRYMMIDADFEYGQEKESAELIDKIKKFGEKYSTPVMIYPTISYPDKPRFRAVFLIARLVDSRKYWSAVTWLYKELDYTSTDATDLRITANRNLPVFCNSEQIEAIYSTFEDDSLKPLQNSLWSDIVAPASKELSEEDIEEIRSFSYDVDKLIAGCNKISKAQIAKSYATFWQLVASVAAAVVLEQIDQEVAEEMMRILASAAEDDYTRSKWETGNIEMLIRFISDYQSINQLMKARPLYTYKEFLKAVIKQ